MSAESEAFRKSFSLLTEGLRSSLFDVLPLLTQYGLISDSIAADVNSMGMPDAQKVSSVMQALSVQIKTNKQAFHIFLFKVLKEKKHLLGLYRGVSNNYVQECQETGVSANIDYLTDAVQSRRPSRDELLINSTILTSSHSDPLYNDSGVSMTPQSSLLLGFAKPLHTNTTAGLNTPHGSRQLGLAEALHKATGLSSPHGSHQLGFAETLHKVTGLSTPHSSCQLGLADASHKATGLSTPHSSHLLGLAEASHKATGLGTPHGSHQPSFTEVSQKDTGLSTPHGSHQLGLAEASHKATDLSKPLGSHQLGEPLHNSTGFGTPHGSLQLGSADHSTGGYGMKTPEFHVDECFLPKFIDDSESPQGEKSHLTCIDDLSKGVSQCEISHVDTDALSSTTNPLPSPKQSHSPSIRPKDLPPFYASHFQGFPTNPVTKSERSSTFPHIPMPTTVSSEESRPDQQMHEYSLVMPAPQANVASDSCQLCADLRDQILSLESEKECLHQTLIDYNTTMTTDRSYLQLKMNEIQYLRNELLDKDEQIMKLRRALEFVQRRCKEIEGSYFKAVERTEEMLKKELENVSQEKAALEAELGRQFMNLKRLEQYIHNIERKLLQEQQQNEELKKRVKELQEKNEQLEHALCLTSNNTCTPTVETECTDQF